MKTITIEAKTIPHFDNLDELFTAAKSGGSVHQVTAQEVLNGRTHVFGNWQEISISSELRENICNTIAENLGGRGSTKISIKNTLRFGRPQHWGLQRVLLEKYGDSPSCFHYCAGQDQTYEAREIRKALTK